MKNCIVIALFLTPLLLCCQPSTEVYLFDLSKEGLKNPVNISNNEGYDNQPSFWPDSQSVLYARSVDGQTEIARYFVDSKETKIITSTLQGSEYSPTPMPGTSSISSVRLDTTGLQLLYRYNLLGESEVLVEDLKIGYHAWISNEEIVTFVLGEPATMQIINVKTGEAKTVGESIGRSLHKVPSRDLYSYVDKSSEPWSIRLMNLATDQSAKVSDVLAGAEDYCWTANEKILMGSGSVIYQMNEIEGWLPFADLKEKFEIEGNISRLSASPDGKLLAVVVAN